MRKMRLVNLSCRSFRYLSYDSIDGKGFDKYIYPFQYCLKMVKSVFHHRNASVL